MRIIGDGNFAPIIRICIWFLGLASALVFYFFATGYLMLWGIIGSVAIAAIGGYAEQANALRIKPFDKEYENAKKTYKKDAEN
ncbi:MAG: hypothetical protein V4448_16355 [Pseudomonadota bacterium]